MELSVEFFPSKTAEGAEKLRTVREELAKALKPTFFSVTFGLSSIVNVPFEWVCNTLYVPLVR